MVVLTGEQDPQAPLQLHAGIVASHKRLNDNRSAQITLEQLGETINGSLAIPHPLGLHALNRQERIGRIIGQCRANAVAPVPAAAHSARIVDVGELAGQRRIDPTLPGELAYIDDAGAVCRCWNWRDGVRTALSDDSADAFLAIECVEPERMGDCQAAVDRLAELLERYLGATVVVKTLVTRDNPCVEL